MCVFGDGGDVRPGVCECVWGWWGCEAGNV